MADDEQPDDTQPPDFGKATNAVGVLFQDGFGFGKLMPWLQNNLVQTLLGAMGILIRGITRIATEFAKGFQLVLEQDNPEIGRLAVTMIGLMFGRNLADTIPGGILNPGNLDENAEAVGAAILESVFGPLQLDGGSIEPGVGRAEAFLGAITNMVTRGFALDMVEEMVPEPWRLAFVHHLEEDLIAGLGLGRIARIVMRPIVTTLVAEPAQWAINLAYRPKLLPIDTAVRLWHRGLVNETELDQIGGRQGWSDENIARHKILHTKLADFATLATLLDHDVIDESSVVADLVNDDFIETAATQKVQAHRLARLDPWRIKAADVWVRRYVDGFISQSAFQQSIQSLALPADVAHLIVELAGAEIETPRVTLSVGELMTAWENNVLTQGEVHDGLVRKGYSEEDATTLVLTRLAIGRHRDEVEQARRDAAAARAAALAQAKADRLAAQQQARLDAAAARTLKAQQLAAEHAQARADAEARREFIAGATAQRHALVDAQHQAQQVSADQALALKAQIDADEKALLAGADAQAADALVRFHQGLLELKRTDREADTAQQLADVDLALETDTKARSAAVQTRLQTVDQVLALKLAELADLFTLKSATAAADLATSIAAIAVATLPTRAERQADAAQKIADLDAALTRTLTDRDEQLAEEQATTDRELADKTISDKTHARTTDRQQLAHDQAVRMAQQSHDDSIKRLQAAAAATEALSVAKATQDTQTVRTAAGKASQKLAADRLAAENAAKASADAEKLRLSAIGAQLGPLTAASAAKQKATISAHDAALKRQETVEATNLAHADDAARRKAAAAQTAVQAARQKLTLLQSTAGAREAAAAAATAQLAHFDADVETKRRALEAEIAAHQSPAPTKP